MVSDRGWGRVVYFQYVGQGGFSEVVLFEWRPGRFNRSSHSEFWIEEISRRLSKYKNLEMKTISDCVKGGDEADISGAKRSWGKRVDVELTRMGYIRPNSPW